MRKENRGGPREEAERLGVQGDPEGIWGSHSVTPRPSCNRFLTPAPNTVPDPLLCRGWGHPTRVEPCQQVVRELQEASEQGRDDYTPEGSLWWPAEHLGLKKLCWEPRGGLVS